MDISADDFLPDSPLAHPRSALRFFRKLEVRRNGCWEWNGARGRQGYGQVDIATVRLSTHRATYMSLVGPIPEGLQIDHLCRNRPCCNPEHLEPVTHAENQRRIPFRKHRRPSTHCGRGHEWTAETTAWNKREGFRICRPCAAAHQVAYRARLALAA